MFGEWLREGVVATVLGASALLFGAGCEEGSEGGEPDRGDIRVQWGEAPDPVSHNIATTFHQTKMFEDVAGALNSGLKFPRDLPVIHAACQQENAFYDGESGRLIMCYELLASIAELANDETSSDEEIGERIVGTWMFVFFHELGHGLIDMYELPVTGREEDAVDDFSTVLLIEAGLADFAIRAAEYWAVTDSGMYDETMFADEHSLNSQRFFNILCTVYGSDPRRYQSLVTSGVLPTDRANRCPAEFQQKRSSWETLLEPWSK